MTPKLGKKGRFPEVSQWGFIRCFNIFSWQLKPDVKIVILQCGVYGPIVGFHDLFDDSQTDSGTPMLTGMGFFTPVKTFKYIRIE